MKFFTFILILSFMAGHGLAQSSTHQVVQDEAWILQSKEPSVVEQLRVENTQWMLETSSRHWSGKKAMTPDELVRLRSIYQIETGKQKVDAFSIISFVEGIEEWEGDLVQMLYSNEKAYVQSGLNVLSAKLRKGSKQEKSLLANNASIVSRLNQLDSQWIEDANIQKKVRQSKIAIKDFLEASSSEELVAEIPVSDTNHLVADMAAEKMSDAKSTTEETSQTLTDEITELPGEHSSNWWIWLVVLVVVACGILIFRPKR